VLRSRRAARRRLNRARDPRTQVLGLAENAVDSPEPSQLGPRAAILVTAATWNLRPTAYERQRRHLLARAGPSLLPLLTQC